MTAELPDDVMAALAGLQAAPAGPRKPTEILKEMLDLAHVYRQVEPDEEDRLVMEEVTSIVQKLLANLQREQDGLMQGKVTPKSLRRAMGG